MTDITFAGREAGYAAQLKAMTVLPNRVGQIERAAKRIVAARARYEAVERLTGVPWAFIGALHYRESDNDFRGVLHNGEKIIGTGKKTRLVPAGRGPFSTWEEAAVDALTIKGFHVGEPPEWTLERIAYEAERFNGFGYAYRKKASPYVWSGTNQSPRGKFIMDGVYDATVTDEQVGVIPVFLRALDIANIPQPGRIFGMGTKTLKVVKGALKTTGTGSLGWFSAENAGLVKGWSDTTGLNILLLLGIFGFAALTWTVLAYMENNAQDAVEPQEKENDLNV